MPPSNTKSTDPEINESTPLVKEKQTQKAAGGLNNIAASNWAKGVMLFACVATKTWQPLAVAASKDGHDYPYNTSSVVILTEVVKLVACAIALGCQFKFYPSDAVVRFSWKESLHFIVPSIMYAIANTLIFFSMMFINPALYHVLGNFKILTAGLMYSWLLKKSLSDLQWLSLILLTLGAIASMPDIDNLSNFVTSGSFVGMMLVLMQCLTSTYGSVYTEKQFKGTAAQSIFWQNIQLYVYGIIVNIIYMLINDWAFITQKGFFHGYDHRTILALVSQSVTGLACSFIFKYLDNIVFVFACTFAMFLTAIISVWTFDFQINMVFVIALLIVSCSIYLYYRHQMPWVKREEERAKAAALAAASSVNSNTNSQAPQIRVESNRK
eukprot:GILI01002492.1.p1 GENE.GILI01002492.1~~GILI01002492.1.p1  ORF type:complete len:382 (+),score=154.57 GILI01002492.1:191-1336(+)